MTKSMSNNDYELLKVFLNRYYEWCYPEIFLSTELPSPSQILEKAEENSLSNAKRASQMAIDGIIEETIDWSPARIAEADERFAAAGTFTLSELRYRHSKKYQKILKRGIIRSETEYYLIKGALDGGFVEMGTPGANQLQEMLDTFEDRIVKNKAV